MTGLPVRQHVGHERAQPVGHPHHVDVETPVPVIGREGPHTALGLFYPDPGVIAENVYIAVCLPTGGFQRRH